MKQNNRLIYVDAARVILLYTVILGHMVSPEGTFFRFLFSFHMPAFFFLSGYCTRPLATTEARCTSYRIESQSATLTTGRPASQNTSPTTGHADPQSASLTAFIKRKARTTLLPYAAFSLLGIAIMILIPSWRPNRSLGRILYKYLYICKPYALGQVWFLVALFWVSLGMYLTQRSCSRLRHKTAEPIAMLTIALASAVMGTLVLPRIPYTSIHASLERLPWKVDTAIAVLPFTIVGYLLRRLLEKTNVIDNKGHISKSQSSSLSSIGTIALWTLAVLAPIITYITGVKHNTYVNVCDMEYGNPAAFYIAAFAGSIWMLVLGVLTEKILNDIFKRTMGNEFASSKNPDNPEPILIRMVTWIGDKSLIIFGIHSFFVWCIIELYSLLTGVHYEVLNDGITALVLAAAVYLISIAVTALAGRMVHVIRTKT